MPRSTLARELSEAEERVAKNLDRIAHQRMIVSQQDDEGLDMALARAILEQLETLQSIHIADRDRLLAEVSLGNNPPSGARSKSEPTGN
jgi:hypothetical protein